MFRFPAPQGCLEPNGGNDTKTRYKLRVSLMRQRVRRSVSPSKLNFAVGELPSGNSSYFSSNQMQNFKKMLNSDEVR